MHTIDQSLFPILTDVSSLSYPQQYRRWTSFLQQLSKASSLNSTTYLQMFLQRFPFVFLEWQRLIFTKPKEQVIDAYTLALARNSRSPELWKQYLERLREKGGDSGQYKKEMERAIQEIGPDLNSHWLFEEYAEMISDVHTKYEFYKKMFTRPINQLEDSMTKFKEWLSTLTQEQVQAVYYRQTRDDKKQHNPSLYILTQITKIYKKTLAYRQKRSSIQSQIKHFYFSDHPDRPQEVALWKKYIVLQRTADPMIIDNICYCYERALMAHTDNISLWQELFHYLENVVGKHVKLMQILRSHKEFFLNFSPKLYFYWCNLEQRDNIDKARQMYIDYQQYKKIGQAQQQPSSRVHIYLRHIQLQIRGNQLMNAKAIYDNLLVLNQNNPDILSYIVVEYGKFIVSKFKEMPFTKDLYKIYFNHLGYNRYLFENYLEFIRHFENNEGFYDELMGILVTGYEKAAKEKDKGVREECLRYIKGFLRVVLGSMNLIKISEKKFYEVGKRITEQTDKQIQ